MKLNFTIYKFCINGKMTQFDNSQVRTWKFSLKQILTKNSLLFLQFTYIIWFHIPILVASAISQEDRRVKALFIFSGFWIVTISFLLFFIISSILAFIRKANISQWFILIAIYTYSLIILFVYFVALGGYSKL